MSIRIMQEVWNYAPADLTPAQKFVLLALAYDARDHDRIARFSPAAKVAELTNQNYSSVRRALSELADRALIVRVGGRAYKGKAQHYRINRLEAHHRASTARARLAESVAGSNTEGAVVRHLRQRSAPVDNSLEALGERSRDGPKALP